jgi:hypothetical protein
MTATLVVNSDLGTYSAALGAAQTLPNGNLTFTSGFLGSTSNFGQSVEVLPNGGEVYAQNMNGLFEYRSYFMNGLYGFLAIPVERDTTTQGSWIGAYGAQGYDVINEPAGLPSYATVTPSGQRTWTWAASTTDPRGLQVPGGTNRIAATWYSPTSFTVDVNLTDGQQHNLELYLVDWDNTNRAEQVQISDATTGLVLSTQSISSFHNGVYLDYRVGGHIVITITRLAGDNAVLSGLFLG